MSSYSDFANAGSEILLKKGDALARGKAANGELLGGTIAQLGTVIPQQVQQAIKQAAEKRKTAQIQSILQQSGGDLDQALPQIMGIDATIGAHLADEHAKVQKSVAEVQKIKQDAAKAQLDISDRLWSGVTDEGSYARAALFSHRLGEEVPDQYDPTWVQQKKQSLLSLKDQLDANKPIVVPRGGTLATPQGKVLAQGTAPAKNEAELAADAADPSSPTQAQSKAAIDVLKGTANTAADNTRADTALAETLRHNKAMETTADYRAKHPAAASSGMAGDDIGAIVDGIIKGEQPPTLQGLYRNGAAVRAGLAKKGYDLASAQTDWAATQKHVATLNGAQQTRMAQAIDNASHSLDVIETLADQWDGGKFPVLNKARLTMAKNGAMGATAQRIATNLEAQISDVTSELGNVYMGGNSPTDHALGLAAKNLSADWTRDQLKSALQLARKNLTIRQNSMRNVGVAGASAGNPYGQQAPPPVAPPTGRYNPKTGKVE